MGIVSYIMETMEKEFNSLISEKNSWGKNEVMRLFS